MVYESGESNTTNGGFVVVYPVPGFVIATLTILPLLIDATPTLTKLEPLILEVPTLTLTVVCIPDL